MCLFIRGRNDLQKHFPHHNWPILIFLYLAVLYVQFIMFNPSMYQFITTPQESQDTEHSTNITWPGLGGTDSDYGWVLLSFAICETAFFPVATVMVDTLPYTPLLLSSLLLSGVGGVVYACATDVWMVILARGVMGVSVLFGSSVLHTYVGEIGTILDEIREKKGKRPVKHILYMVVMFATNGMQVVMLGINAGIVRIPSVNPYRLPGWFLAGLALLSATIVVPLFSEPRPWACRIKRRKLLSGFGLSMKLTSKTRTDIFRVAFILACGFVNGQTYAVIYTLVTPVLSDQFGFTVANTALFYVGLAVGSFAACIIQLIAKGLKGNNRIVVALALTISLIGCVLFSDWQAIGGDIICPLSTNLTGLGENTMVELCEAQSSSGHQCFWNPQSRITGDDCDTCLATCLSHQASLNFYQFNVGVFLLMTGSVLEYIFNLALISDITPAENQGALITLTIACGALARAISPLWFVESYDSTGRHTYLPLSITIACLVILLLSLVALYKDLAPRSTTLEMKEAVNALSQEVADIEKASIILNPPNDSECAEKSSVTLNHPHDHECEEHSPALTHLDVWYETAI